MRFWFSGPSPDKAMERRKTFWDYHAVLVGLFKIAAAIIITGVLLLMLWVVIGVVKS